MTEGKTDLRETEREREREGERERERDRQTESDHRTITDDIRAVVCLLVSCYRLEATFGLVT